MKKGNDAGGKKTRATYSVSALGHKVAGTGELKYLKDQNLTLSVSTAIEI